MRERSLKLALVCLSVAVVAYAGCSDGETTGSTTGDTSTSTSTSTGSAGGTGGTGMTTSASTTSASTTSTGAGGTGGTGGAGMSTSSSTSSGSGSSGSGSSGSGSSGSGSSGSGSSSTSSSSSGSSSSASTSSGGNVGTLGDVCTVDANCGGGYTCIASSANVALLGGGGPANGYCSKNCAADGDCPGLGGVCIGASGMVPGICLLTCDIGPALTSLDEPLDPAKCHGREDARCSAVNAAGTVTACLPTCGRNDECPAGRACDPRTSVCVDVANTGLPMGAKCNAAAPTPECAGQCVSFSGGQTMCSSPCVLGGDFTDLAAVADCGGLDKGLCAFSPAGNGAGDFGICSPACSTHGDCQNPTFWCNNVGLPSNGYCFGATACPNGQAACTNPDKCTATKYGPFCLDTTYPLGTAALVGPGSNN